MSVHEEEQLAVVTATPANQPASLEVESGMEPMTDGPERAGTNQVTISGYVCNYEPCGLYSYLSKFVQVRNDAPKPALHVAPPSIAPEEYFSKEKNKAKLKFRVRLDSH